MNDAINSLFIIYLIVIFQAITVKLIFDELKYLEHSKFDTKEYFKTSFDKSYYEYTFVTSLLLSLLLFFKIDNLLIFLLTMFLLIPTVYFTLFKIKKIDAGKNKLVRKKYFIIEGFFLILLYSSLFFITKETFLLIILIKILLLPFLTKLNYYIYKIIFKIKE